MKKIPKWLELEVDSLLAETSMHAETNKPSDCAVCRTFITDSLLVAYNKGKRAGERKRKK